MSAQPLRTVDGALLAYACSYCLTVVGINPRNGTVDRDTCVQLARERAERCCQCRTCGAFAPYPDGECEPCRFAWMANIKSRPDGRVGSITTCPECEGTTECPRCHDGDCATCEGGGTVPVTRQE